VITWWKSEDRIRYHHLTQETLMKTYRAPTMKTEMVTFRSGAETISSFLVLPKGRGRHGGVIVLHEWWGLNDWVKMQATSLAANGYVAMAVDLYRGRVTENPSEARKLKRGLPDDRAINDMTAAFHYLATHPNVDSKHIGSIGWSMGGRLAIQLAIHETRLAACVVNYGVLPADLADVKKIHAQVLVNCGALDRGIPPSRVRAFEKLMKAAGQSADIKIYTGAGHAFENPSNKSGYRPEAAADAWCRTLSFFAQTIKAESRKVHCGGG
jgi:carboxymethylenebutenolidase